MNLFRPVACLSALVILAACEASGTAPPSDAVSSTASGWNIKPQDERLTDADLAQLLPPGTSLVYTNGDRSVLVDDTAYEFRTGGEVYRSTYAFTPEGEICLERDGQPFRCDLIVQRDGDLISINEQGSRYKARIE